METVKGDGGHGSDIDGTPRRERRHEGGSSCGGDVVVVDNDVTAPLISEGNGLMQGADAVIGKKTQCDPGPGDDGWSAHFAYLDAARGRRSEGIPMQSTVAVVVDDMVPEIVQEV